MSLTAHPIILNQAEELTWEAAYDILTAQDEKYVEYKIHESSFHTLKGVQYLNDEIVNGFLSVLAETRNKTRNDTFVISSQLTTAIIDRTDRVPRNLFCKVKFASQSLLIGMYNQVVHFEHWIFVAIDIPNKMFYFLDPLKHSDLASNALASFRDYFVLRQEKGIDDSLLLDDYKIIQIKSRIQYDDYNCGVLSLKLAEQLCFTNTINESLLKKLNLKETRSEIGIELLQQSVDLSDLCVMCGSADLYDNWVKCTQCQCWQHTECVNEVISDNFLCCTCTRL